MISEYREFLFFLSSKTTDLNVHFSIFGACPGKMKRKNCSVIQFSFYILSLSPFIFSYTPLSLYHSSTYIIILIDCSLLLSFRVFLTVFFIFAFVLINFTLPLSWSLCACRFDPFLAITIAISDYTWVPKHLLLAIIYISHIIKNRKDIQITWTLHQI